MNLNSTREIIFFFGLVWKGLFQNFHLSLREKSLKLDTAFDLDSSQYFLQLFKTAYSKGFKTKDVRRKKLCVMVEVGESEEGYVSVAGDSYMKLSETHELHAPDLFNHNERKT